MVLEEGRCVRLDWECVDLMKGTLNVSALYEWDEKRTRRAFPRG